MKYLIISLLWAGYCAVHSFLISIGFSNTMSRLLKKYYAFYRLFYVVFSLVTLIWLINYTDQFDNEIIVNYSPPLSVLRYFLLSGSLILFFWAFFFSYDPLHFFGIRQIMNFARSGGTGQPGEIRKNGLLGIIRHPMYLALIIFLWAQIITLADLIVNIVLTVYVIIGTKLEEKKLIIEFGSAYKKYQKEVPMLIPSLKKRHLGFR